MNAAPGENRRGRGLLAPVVAVVVVLAMSSCIWVGPDGTSRALRYQPVLSLGASQVGDLVEEWHADLGHAGSFSPTPTNPVVDGDVAVVAVRVGATSGPLNTLLAFDAHGCEVSPCPPIWRATGTGFGQPMVHRGQVYVVVDGTLAVYALRPTVGCQGDPLVCGPLWRSSEPASNVAVGEGLVVTGVLVYAAGDGSSCAGTPKTCAPLRRLHLTCSGIIACTPSQAAIGDGSIAIGFTEGDEDYRDGYVAVFDADGSACLPADPLPALCEPRMVGTTGGAVKAAPSIHDGGVTVQAFAYHYDHNEEVYDYLHYEVRSVPIGPGEPPATFQPFLWSTDSSRESGAPVVTPTTIVVQDGRRIRAFDRATQTIRWEASMTGFVGRTIAGGGVVFAIVGTTLHLLDLDGVEGCSGTPVTCTSLRAVPGVVGTALSNNRVWLTQTDGTLRVLAAP